VSSLVPGYRPSLSRRRTLMLLLTLGCLLMTLIATAPTQARQPGSPSLSRFMWALAGEESGWNYFERNRQSDAFGKYQIMPANWPAWAQRYLGSRWADPSPYAQEVVARSKVTDLYRWLGSWSRVAYWWLTGRDDARPANWSSLARGYVHNVLALMSRAPAHTATPPRPAHQNVPVIRGAWRQLAANVVVRSAPGHQAHPVGRIADWTTVITVASRWFRHQVWLRVATAKGTTGWVRADSTFPMRRPPLAARWIDSLRVDVPLPDPRALAGPTPH